VVRPSIAERRPALVLRNMRGHCLLAQFHHKVAGVIAFVGTERDRLRMVGVGLDQLY
jgi:hypothetical protein